MRHVIQDTLYAIRLLRKSPGLAAVAILSLAIGIGGTSGMFSFADALILRPLAVRSPGEMVTVNGTSKSRRFSDLSWREYVDYRDSARSVTGLVAYQTASFALSATREELPQLVYGMVVSGNFFKVLGVPPVLGRDFRPEDDTLTAVGSPAMIVSHAFWRERLNGDPNVPGSRIRLNGHEFTVIGVAPRSFTGMDQFFQPALYVPVHTASLALPNAPPSILEDRGYRWLSVIGRVAKGSSVEAVRAEFSTIASRLAETFPETNRDEGVVVLEEMKARFQRNAIEGLLAMSLMGIAALVLLIACANIANLMLARGVARTREIAIRLSIGAGRGRLIRQLLTESLLLSTLAGTAGLLVAYGTIRALASIKLPTDMPIAIAVRMDERVLVFSLAATVLATLVFGLMPAWRASRTDVVSCLRGATVQAAKAGRKFSLRDALVVAQVSVGLAVLSAAGLLVKSFVQSQTFDLGFRTEGVLMMSFDASLVRLDRTEGQQFYQQLMERVRALPGVQSATLCRHVPMGFSGGSQEAVVDGYEMPRDQQSLRIDSNVIGTDYFRTLNSLVVRGRSFNDGDHASAQPVVIVNETMARRYWPDREPLGARIRLGAPHGKEAVVVGIAKDATYRSTFESKRPHLYLPFAQDYQPQMTLFALAANGNDPAGLTAAIRNEVRAIRADVPIFDVRSFRQFYEDRSLMLPRLISQIVTALGVVGVSLAVIGLYGVIAYTVTRRTKEIGIRMAIGADASSVSRLVLRQGLRLSLIGVVVGIPLGLVLLRMMSGLMLDRSPRPEPVLAIVTALLISVALLAAWIPSRRAARIDPMVALRDE
jgi:predicted permease